MRSFPVTGAVLVGAALIFCAAAKNAAADLWTASLSGLQSIHLSPDGAPLAIDHDGQAWRLTFDGHALELAPAPLPRVKQLPPDALPDGVVARAPDDTEGWLAGPTTRYGHGVLGDAIEAGSISFRYVGGETSTLTLTHDRVFEDRYPRFTDLDGDGRTEAIVVTSYLDAGGALTVIDIGKPGGPSPRVVAEGPAIGTPNRWMNPVGAGDVDGDGRIEVLAVITPHIGGALTAYEWQGDRLVVEHQVRGFSNHAIGSRELALSAVADMDGDGTPEAIVPDAVRERLTVVKFTGGAPRVVADIAPGGRVAHRLVVFDLDGDGRPELIFGTDRETLVVWRPTL